MHATIPSLDQTQQLASQFELTGHVTAIQPYGNGHINDTYLVETTTPGGHRAPWIFQRVNHAIFTDVPRLMENIERVTHHLRLKLGAPTGTTRQRILTLIPTTTGKPCLQDAAGHWWRVYEFLSDTETIEAVAEPRQAYEAAKSFAQFQGQLRDLPAPRLHETIPHFHDTPKRYRDFEAALAADPRNRAREIHAEIAFAQTRAPITAELTKRLASGELPERVTHNDTKINNIRFDCASGCGAAVIDLDTVMPGLVHYDFGDMMRTAVFQGAEDERRLDQVVFRQDFFNSLLQGYLEGGREFLTPAELDWLPFSGRLICLEIGLRFLTDHLQGDTYFKIHRPGHNLDRARVQFQRVVELEKAMSALDAQLARLR